MFVVLGATGHVGSAVANALLAAGEAVTIVSRSERKAEPWRAKGADIAVVDVGSRAELRKLFRRAKRAFLLNPPAAPSTDTDVEERRTAAAIVEALDGSGLEKIVAQSVYGARPGTRTGDLTVLYGFEQALFRQPIPTTSLRAAYYMSNWDALLPCAKDGTLPTMLPAGLEMPMVAPADLGEAAARFLREPVEKTGIRHVEGPDRYSPGDVASAFSEALGRKVELVVTPPEQWEEAFRKIGFSEPAAASYARMTAATAEGSFPSMDEVERGSVTLVQYVEDLVARHGSDAR